MKEPDLNQPVSLSVETDPEFVTELAQHIEDQYCMVDAWVEAFHPSSLHPSFGSDFESEEIFERKNRIVTKDRIAAIQLGFPLNDSERQDYAEWVQAMNSQGKEHWPTIFFFHR